MEFSQPKLSLSTEEFKSIQDLIISKL
jgi:hypothetical protein